MYQGNKIKARANYLCERCGSGNILQAHAPNGDHSDWQDGIALCPECHSKEHPNVAHNLICSIRRKRQGFPSRGGIIVVETKSLLSPAQTAQALKRPRLTIYRWIKAEKVQAIKLGGILYIPRSEVERLKDERDSQPLPMP